MPHNIQELAQCPFCGELNVKYSFHVPRKFSCQTRGCPLVGVLFTTEQWNTRPAESRIKAEGIREAIANCDHYHDNQNSDGEEFIFISDLIAFLENKK